MTKRTGILARRLGAQLSGVAAAAAIAAAGIAAPIHAQTASEFAASFAPFAALPPAARQSGAVDLSVIETPAEAESESGPADEIGSGMASWYGSQFRGQRTASGEAFDPDDYTAAHRSLPFGSRVRVTNSRTGQSVIVRINDRGPFARSRVIDVSKAAARDLGLIGPGHAEVSLALLSD